MKKKISALCAVMLVFSMAFAVVGTGVNGKSKTNISTADARTFAAENDESTTNSIAGIVGDAVSGIGSGASGALGDVVSNVVGGIGSDSGSDSSGGLGGALGGIGSGSSGGIGDVVGGIGDTLGSVVGGIGSGSGSSGGLLDSFGNVVSGLLGSGSQGGGTTSVTYDVGYITPIPAATQNANQGVVTQAAPQSGSTQLNTTATAGTTATTQTSLNPYQKPAGKFKQGDEGDAIKWMQWIFASIGYGLTENDITGVFDENTLAAVKRLQQEKGLTVDGVVNDAVINHIERLYYEKLYGVETTAPVVPSIGAYETLPTSTEGEKNNNVIWIVVIVLAVIWIIAITVILVLFFLKKKKTAKTDKAEDKKKAEASTETKSGNMSMSDLFEDANK